MEISEEQKREYAKRLVLARTRMLCNAGFYGYLVMHLKFALDGNIPTAATDGEKISFSPKFLDELCDDELDFVLMHEVLHVALRHVARRESRDPERFNIACDIVVNSNILSSFNGDKSRISIRGYGTSMHLAPDGREGAEYTAEQVYDMLPETPSGNGSFKVDFGDETDAGGGLSNGNDAGGGSSRKGNEGGEKGRRRKKKVGGGTRWDDHSKWATAQNENDEREKAEIWRRAVAEAAEGMEIRSAGNSWGSVPEFAKRILKEIREPQNDWRTVLADFVQEEICDYSFSPPDKRYGDSPFFLPDFNDAHEVVRKILFAVDTSGSISDDMLVAAYSEVLGAIAQFGGALEGFLGYFDAVFYPPKPFSEPQDVLDNRPIGGGGTNFHSVFEYVKKEMTSDPPASIIILTDGVAPFPLESAAMGIPVLWVLHGDGVTPPWGRIARIYSAANGK